MPDAKRQILEGSRQAHKTFAFSEQDPRLPAQWWYQHSPEGLVLFVVYYTLACRWNRCVGCNLPSKSSVETISFRDVVAQVDALFDHPEIAPRLTEIHKVILSNNGSMLDQHTFPSTSLMYLMTQLNLRLPELEIVSMETRVEYVEWEELEFLARVLKERDKPAELELAVGFEAYDDHIRNDLFQKGLSREQFEKLVGMVGQHGYSLKCYFMQKPVPGMTDDEAVQDIHAAIAWLDDLTRRFSVSINMHLNPTYVARGTPLEQAFQEGRYRPPLLTDVVRAVMAGRDRDLSIFVGLNDEGLAVPGGSFLRQGDESLAARIERFNRTQDYSLLLSSNG